MKPDQVFRLPSSRRCVSRRKFTIRIRKVKGVRYKQAVAVLTGKGVRGPRVRVVPGNRIKAGINLRGLPRGTFKLKSTVTTVGGQKIRGTRTYHTCTRKRGGGRPRL